MSSEADIVFESDPFAEGRFRYAYKGTWVQPVSRAGEKCVVKKFKDIYTWEHYKENIFQISGVGSRICKRDRVYQL